MKSEHSPESEHDDPDVEGRRLERIVPEIVRRILEAGYERISEGPENVRKAVGELRLPKEALAALFAQLDETKSGLYRAVAREVREVLERTSFAEEITRALTAVSFEITTTVRFVPNDPGDRSSNVHSRASVRRRDSEASRDSSPKVAEELDELEKTAPAARAEGEPST